MYWHKLLPFECKSPAAMCTHCKNNSIWVYSYLYAGYWEFNCKLICPRMRVHDQHLYWHPVLSVWQNLPQASVMAIGKQSSH